MSILSFEFLLLAAGVTIVYYLLPLRLSWMALLSGSAAFLLLSGWQSAAHLSAAALMLPLGLSYYTFQAAGYLIDGYRGKAQAQKNPLKAWLFLG